MLGIIIFFFGDHNSFHREFEAELRFVKTDTDSGEGFLAKPSGSDWPGCSVMVSGIFLFHMHDDSDKGASDNSLRSPKR